MKAWISFSRRFPVIVDGLAVVALGGFIKFLTVKFDINWDTLGTDQVGLILAILGGLSLIGGYLGLVQFGDKNQKIKRLRASSQFQKIIMILLAYTVGILVMFFVQLAFPGLLEWAIAFYAVVIARIVWIYFRTVRLL